MRPQFFPWLFDDKSAWEKSLADPRYTYELPMDHFMCLYSAERKAGASGQGLTTYLIPMVQSAPVVPVAPASSAVFSSPLGSPLASAPAQAAKAPAKEEAKQEGILSQDEIDALLSGL